MDAVSYSDLRQNLKRYLDRVYGDREALIVTRKDNENVVMISLDEYNSLVETSYLLSSEANAKHLSESLSAARSAAAVERELIDE
ncbi:MAG: type II toxin-antitoxin system prevent-host-death family antitoxin [Spirochaetes bacterium]|jgi:antitoxin YefM|nr:type II toxin-antitoxin system prevent-host-death family antitoxin [Spirochaetota bacterium]